MNHRFLPSAAIALALAVPSAFAQDKAEPPKTADKPAAEKPAEPKKEEPKKDPKTADFEKAVKDLKRIEGPFTLYQRKREILLELPEDKLGQLFLFQSTLHTALDGSLLHAGMPLNLGEGVDVFRFDRNEENVWLVRPNTKFAWEKDDPLLVGIQRTFPEAILGSYRIEQTNPEKKLLLINVTNLFYGEPVRLNEQIAGMLGGPYTLDRDKTNAEEINGYPENTVVRMSMHFVNPRGVTSADNPLAALLGFNSPNTLEDPRSAPVKVTYNVWWRKPEGYQARFFDPRVGFFTTSRFSFNRYAQMDRTESFINRFRLVKKDPKAAVSDPVKPIVWTIDPSIPVKYRQAVRDGVMMWDPAFRAAGFSNAIKVQDVPKDDTKYDHADGRYNVIRFSPSEDSLFAAIALARTDPLNGEVLNASVTIDANIFWQLGMLYRMASPTLRPSRERALEILTRRSERTVPDDVFVFEPKAADLLAAVAKIEAHDHTSHEGAACTLAEERAPLAALALMAMDAAPMKVSREEFLKAYLRDTVAHEVGHTLGLRHNFAASTQLSTAQLADEKLTKRLGVASSVMDYTPPNIQAVLRGQGQFFNSVVGPYDQWAIQYGYQPFAGKSTLGERFDLSLIARKSAQPGHAYMTDEDADGFDPYAVRFDLASDPVRYSRLSLEGYRRARNTAIKNLPQPGRPYSDRTLVVMSTISRSFREGRTMARFIGGMKATRSFKGDPGAGAPLAPISPELQREAMKSITTYLLSANAFVLPPEVMTSMVQGAEGPGWDAPLRDLLGSFQQSLLALTMSATTTDRIAENAFKTGAGAYDVSEHYSRLLGAVFSEVGSGKPISPLRRDLQRFMVTGLITQAGAPAGSLNEDTRSVAGDSLVRLQARLANAAKAPGLDGMSRSHLRDSAAMIQRFLNRSVAVPR